MLAAIERIEIGDHVMFANGCFVGDADHRYDDPDVPITWQGFVPRGPVRIGDNVWFGVNCVVTGGVEIGDRAVIGANSVVTRDIPPATIAAGAPAKVIREIEFEPRDPEDALVSACAPAPTRSSPATRRPASSGSPSSRTGSRSARSSPGRGPGVGAVATQSVAEPAYGPRLLDRLATRRGPGGRARGRARGRRLGALPAGGRVDAAGRVAAHTGDGCMDFAGHGSATGFSAQANMMASAAVWPAMAAAFEAASGPLERRLLAALEAAEEAGGDVRGKQSAALLVVPGRARRGGRRSSCGSRTRPSRCLELRRLLDLHDAYEVADRADALAGEGRHDEAAELYRRPPRRRRESVELGFWAGLGIAASGDVEAGAERVRQAIARRRGLASAALEAGARDRAVGRRRARGARDPEGVLGDDLEDHRALARAVVEVDQHELLPGAERQPAADDRDDLGGSR